METAADYNNQRAGLIALGSERLADLLLSAASRYPEVARMVERTLVAPTDVAAAFRRGLREIISRKEFVDRREAKAYRAELVDLLNMVKRAGIDPETGIKLVVEFFRADGALIERGDDPGGNMASVFDAAANLFARFAAQCADKQSLIAILVDLYAHDKYGMRASLMRVVHKFMDTDMLRSLVDELTRQAGERDKCEWLEAQRIVAQQLNDLECE